MTAIYFYYSLWYQTTKQNIEEDILNYSPTVMYDVEFQSDFYLFLTKFINFTPFCFVF